MLLSSASGWRRGSPSTTAEGRNVPRMQAYVKAIIAILGGVSAWGITAAADNSITAVELYGLLGALATALGVYAFPNRESEG